MGEDCPVFDNLFEFCQIYAGGTIGESINLKRLCRCVFCILKRYTAIYGGGYFIEILKSMFCRFSHAW